MANFFTDGYRILTVYSSVQFIAEVLFIRVTSDEFCNGKSPRPLCISVFPLHTDCINKQMKTNETNEILLFCVTPLKWLN